MKAFLIDPAKQTVSEIEFYGDWREINRLIGSETFDCVTINGKGDVVFVDDEGLLKGLDRFFSVQGYPEPLVGRGLVLGCDAEGETVEPAINLGLLSQLVAFGRPAPEGWRAASRKA